MPSRSRLTTRRLLVGLAAPLLALAACTGAPAEDDGAAPTSAPTAATSTTTSTAPDATAPSDTSASGTSPARESGPARTLLRGLEIAWSIAPLPDGSALVSERDTGDIHHVPAPGSGASPTVVGRLPIERTSGEGGLLGLAVPEDFDVNPVFYAYYSTDSDNRIAAVPWHGDRIGEPKVIFDGIPRGHNHNGGRIAFGPNGYLYVGTGEAGDTSLSQNRESLGGKILRITPEGEPAPGNPFGGSPIWSYGHRNVQGLAWDSAGRMWASEFGAQTWDELNLIKPGSNYGWPEAEGRAGNPDFVDPVVQWATADLSPSGIAIGPDGAVYLAALRGESVWRVPIRSDGSAGEPERRLRGTYGRIRDVRFVSGRLWLTTSNGSDDRLISLPLADVGVG
ncbi:PQQ-dependent sugar dehydrogenase [Intrasporangium calvum]|uniref:Oxidoreductase n=1 Tax=Intrasporangium calvum (strain ATCC 23552 / DSM 43043 / JCM 3097 / NBRC 12989 / NCIMB 10167 / NRRL B-3866 / 7 KIP) TaxID=710696 RepID=E6SFU9_INTC7|nr:PQQ-dependent sugar dehydrogenase [Intrasporangium calvum]ADU48878.1 oxidoreductase [Intrasporangium calvum DSM 43043]